MLSIAFFNFELNLYFYEKLTQNKILNFKKLRTNISYSFFFFFFFQKIVLEIKILYDDTEVTI
jgi:hypothetical protein